MAAAALSLAAPAEPARGRAATIEEWFALDEDEPGELVDGHIEEEEVPDAGHELAVTWLATLLSVWLGSRGFVLGSEAKYRVAPQRGRKPDLTVYLPGTTPPRRRGPLSTPPDIAIEIVTATTRDERRDRVEKRLEYARFGVRWYWLVDPALGSFEVLELDTDGLYRFAASATSGAVESVPGCSGLRIDIDELWARLAQLGPDEA